VKLPLRLTTGIENRQAAFDGRPVLVDALRPRVGSRPRARTPTCSSSTCGRGHDVARFEKGHSFVRAIVNGPELNVFGLLPFLGPTGMRVFCSSAWATCPPDENIALGCVAAKLPDYCQVAIRNSRD
jgi:hypothetical protein